MGGVDLHDNGVQNYRVNIRAKKWYWPLFLSLLNSAAVNAWKLHSFIARYKCQRPMQQKDFRVAITSALLLTPDNANRASEDRAPDGDEDYVQPLNMPRLSGEHLIVKQAEGKERRCKKCHKPCVYMCQKCNVHLHIKCFPSYNHNKT